MSSFQNAVLEFRAYSNQDARAHIALQLASEAGELAGWFGKRLYKPVEPAALVEELSDCLHYLAQLCTEVGLTLADIPPKPVHDVTLERRLLRLHWRAGRMGDALLMEYRREWFTCEIGYQLHDLDFIRAEAERLRGSPLTWADIEAANIRKLTGDPSKQGVTP